MVIETLVYPTEYVDKIILNLLSLTSRLIQKVYSKRKDLKVTRNNPNLANSNTHINKQTLKIKLPSLHHPLI